MRFTTTVIAAAMIAAGASAPALADDAAQASGAQASAGHPAAAAGTCPHSAREIVEKFNVLFYTERNIRKAFETWVAPDYIQHNPVAADGRDNAIAALEPFVQKSPEFRYEVKRVIAEGDFVAVHVHGKPTPGDRGFAVVDIFRIENCKIAEHWDVIQPVPEKSANPHPMF